MCESHCNHYQIISLYKNDALQWMVDGNFTADYILGVVSVGLPLIYYRGYYKIYSCKGSKIISCANDLRKLGRDISILNISTDEALQISNGDNEQLQCNTRMFRKLCGDQDHLAVWVFDHKESQSIKWNLIMTHCAKDFLHGFSTICYHYQVDMWDYML